MGWFEISGKDFHQPPFVHVDKDEYPDARLYIPPDFAAASDSAAKEVQKRGLLERRTHRKLPQSVGCAQLATVSVLASACVSALSVRVSVSQSVCAPV